jgi:release factor glutamine methyltransferase
MAEYHQLPSRDYITSEEWQAWEQLAEALAKCQPTATLPSLNHLDLSDFDHVYEPAADTFLLLDAIQYEIDRGVFDHHNDALIVLEIGCGSGVPSIFFRQHYYRKKQQERSQTLLSFATDVNPKALAVTQSTAIANGMLDTTHVFELVQCDLASSLRLNGRVNVILFNPPYVPTPNEEVASSGIEASWAGGEIGRVVIDRSIEQIARLLCEPNGVAYMITVDDNRPFELAKNINKFNLEMKPLFRRRARNERLTVQKITWSKSATKDSVATM